MDLSKEDLGSSNPIMELGRIPEIQLLVQTER
jgi:hypothetical protein